MKKLRWKMVLAAFFSLVVVFVLVISVTHIFLAEYHSDEADEMLQLISVNDGDIPRIEDYEESTNESGMPDMRGNFNAESRYKTRYFIVYYDINYKDSICQTVDIEHIASVNTNEAISMLYSVLKTNNKHGYISKYRYYKTKINNQTCVIFLDCAESFQSQKLMLETIAVTSAAFTVLVTIVFAIFSKRTLRPFEENQKMQKQFITDASHELKTPLAIISANAEVLQYKNGDDEWTKNIITQTKRMSSLINELLALSRTQEADENIPFEPLDYSKLVTETVATFNEIFENKHVTVETDIEDGIKVSGNKKYLTELINLLTENASKYVTENGNVKIKLSATVKYAAFTIFNTADIKEKIDTDKLFERFYRPDSSRTSSTGGHGIGLSIVKNICKIHGGNITAKQTDNGIEFKTEIKK